jgi:arsenate reductase-like glutaredoxin family protein
MLDMGVLARDDKQLTLIYSSNTRVGTHVLAYVQSIQEKLLTVDIAKTKVADTVWVELAHRLGVKVGDLIDKRMVESHETSDFGTNDWLKILQNNNEVLSYPIAVNGDHIAQIKNAPDIMEFFGVDSAGLKKTFNSEPPVIKNTTKKERFK